MGDSRVENILEATINGDEYDTPPYSRVENLLIDLKNSGAGGGGGTNDYNDLINKPTINGHELSGDMSSGDIGVADRADNTYDADDEEVIINQGKLSNSRYVPESENLIIGG